MASQTKITVTHDKETTAEMVLKLITQAQSPKLQILRLANMLERILNGVANGIVTTVIDDGNAVAATGTVTFSGVSTANDTLVINGTTFTAVASGATGNQWNVGGSANAQATNLASAINAAASLTGLVTAQAVGAVVTLSAATAGLIGNAVTFAKGTDAGSVMTLGGLSGGRLSGGLAATNSSTTTSSVGL